MGTKVFITFIKFWYYYGDIKEAWEDANFLYNENYQKDINKKIDEFTQGTSIVGNRFYLIDKDQQIATNVKSGTKFYYFTEDQIKTINDQKLDK